MATGIELAAWHRLGAAVSALGEVESTETSGDELASFPVDEVEGPAEAMEDGSSGDEQETRPPPRKGESGPGPRGPEPELDPDLKRE
eukprot:3635473-Pyramimonas_sp.AAC.1